MIYHIIATVGMSVHTDVEADSLEQALEIAEQRTLCSIGSPESHGAYPDSHWCHSGEIDGTPRDLECESQEES